MSRLSVSNLAWPQSSEPDVLSELAGLGVAGIEVAPTRLAPWEDMTSALLRAYRARLTDAGLKVSSLQAILYGRNDLSLLGSDANFDALAEHMRQVAEIAAELGAEVLVFGSPRNRLRGDMPPDRAWAIASDRWRQLGDVVAPDGLVIGIEPVPAYYGGDFLAGWADVLRMVQHVDHAGIRVHLDTACVALGGDSITDAIVACMPWLVHFHAAQTDLADFSTPAANHVLAAQALSVARYDRWIAIEMREQPKEPVAATIAAVKAIKAVYGSLKGLPTTQTER